MKRWIAGCISLFLAMSLTACGAAEPIGQTPETSSSTSVQSSTATPNTTQPPAQTKPPESTQGEPYLVYSPYVVKTTVREYLGDDYDLYCKMVDSVINYDGYVSGFSSEEQFFNLWRIMREEWPPAQMVCANYGTTDEPYTYKDGACQIAFQYDRSEHDQVIQAFSDRITKDLSCVNKGDTEVEMIAKLYMHASTEMNYAYGSGFLYECIMNNSGICNNYAEYLILLLSQAGIECYLAGGSGAGIDHAWVIAKMNGQFYHFDPTWENASRNWAWFAIDDELRHASLDPSELGTLQTYGDWDYETNTWLPPQVCPESFCQDTREDDMPPWKW